MENVTYITLRERPELKNDAAQWFHQKWGVPVDAYLACMDAYLANKTEYGWYLCLNGSKIVGGMGVIENDFHEWKDLTPNVCAVYTEKDYRCHRVLPGICWVWWWRICAARAFRRCILSPTTLDFMSGTAGNFCAWCRATENRR